MPLTDAAIRTAKPRDRAYKLGDAGGLFLLVTPTGGRLWRLKYRFAGKEQSLAFGGYPDVSLKDARERRDEARRQIAAGRNPAVEKKRAAIAAVVSARNTFKAIADEVIARAEAEGKASATLAKARWFLSLLERDLGARPVAEIEPSELLVIVKKFERIGQHETAHRLLAFAGRVFRYAIVTSRARSNPADALRGALTARPVKHHAAIVEPAALGGLLRAIDGYDGQPITRMALQLAPHVFLRPGELRQAEWRDIGFDEAVWRVPAGRAKMRREHVVPLSTQALALLREARLLAGVSRYVFPSLRSLHRPMSENTINAALRRLGYSGDEMTGHGFRSTASTLLNEAGRWTPDAIERALAHADDDKVRAAYHRGAHWHERVEMAQWWSDYLDTLRQGTTVIPLRFKAAS